MRLGCEGILHLPNFNLRPSRLNYRRVVDWGWLGRDPSSPPFHWALSVVRRARSRPGLSFKFQCPRRAGAATGAQGLGGPEVAGSIEQPARASADRRRSPWESGPGEGGGDTGDTAPRDLEAGPTS